ATEALTYPAREAVEVGFADRIGPLDEALKIYEGDVNQQPEEETMSKTITEEEHNAAVAAARTDGEKAGHAKGLEEGTAAGAKAAQDRMSAVFASPEAADRPKAAVKLLGNPKLASMDA